MVKCKVISRKWEGHLRGAVVNVPKEVMEMCSKDLKSLEEPVSVPERTPDFKSTKQSNSWKSRKNKGSNEESKKE